MSKKVRKAIKFYRSYFDVVNELENDKDKLDFLMALLNRQFNGIEPTHLTGLTKLVYVSQKHSIDKQVEGWEFRTKEELTPMEEGNEPPTPDPMGDPYEPPYLQEKEEEKEKEKEKEKGQEQVEVKEAEKVIEQKLKEKEKVEEEEVIQKHNWDWVKMIEELPNQN